MGSSIAEAELCLRELDGDTVKAAAHSPSDLLRVNVLSSAAAIAEMETAWRALEERVSSTRIFQTHGWCLQWARNVEALGISCWQIRVVTVLSGGRLVLVWPLAIARGKLLKTARWLGEPLTQYGDVLAEDTPNTQAWIEQAWQAICSWSDVDLVWLRKVRADACVAPFLDSRRNIVQGEPEVALAIDLKPFDDWAALDETYKAKTRKNRKRFRRRLTELGLGPLEFHMPGPKAHELLEAAISFKESWLEKRGAMSNPFRDPLFRNTLCAMVRGDGPDVGCQVFALRVGDTPVAIEIGFNWHGRYVAHVAALNPDYDKYGPGNVLTEDIVAWLIERDDAYFDLMSPGDDYKRSWTNTETPISSFAQPLSLIGSFYVRQHLARLRPGLKHLHERLPIGIRRLVARLRGTLG